MPNTKFTMLTENWQVAMKKVNSFIKKISFKLSELLRRKGHGISILVPLQLDELEGHRAINWRWLRRYWKHHLPGAEIIIGEDKQAARNGTPFSKSVAVNDAARKANGDVFVIIDADIYIHAKSLIYCAEEIKIAQKKGRRLWFMPYRQAYRLTKEASKRVLNSNPQSPVFPPEPLPDADFSNKETFKGTPSSRIAHWYGAMIQIVPREAFYEVGGWDIRFKGWGGEDHAAMVAMDTLYGPHKTLPGRVLHLWHPTRIAADDPAGKRRLWANQESNNNALSGRYFWSRGFPKRMRRLVNEFLEVILLEELEELEEELEEIIEGCGCDSP